MFVKLIMAYITDYINLCMSKAITNMVVKPHFMKSAHERYTNINRYLYL